MAYLVFMLPAMALALIATILTKTTFARYSRRSASSGMSGAQAARRLLDDEGLSDVAIQRVQGFLSDHYDPAHRVLRLSPDVHDSRSLSAIGVACHEAGHAIQHARHYAPLAIRSFLVPVTQFGTIAPYVLFALGALLHQFAFIKLGLLLFSVVVVFSVITLPVEWDASRRAKRLMVAAGIVSQGEMYDAGKVLNAAFLTYVAGAVSALASLLYFMMQFGLLGGRRDG